MRCTPFPVWLAIGMSLAACREHTVPPAAAPVVAGLAQPGLGDRVRGLVLLGELGCVDCHQDTRQPASVESRPGPELATVATRVRADYLLAFLRDPQRTKAGTPMPDLFADRDATARSAAAVTLTAYLQSFSVPDAAVEAEDPAAARRGRELFHTIGCVACHAPRDDTGREMELAASVPLALVPQEYSFAGLRAFLLAPLAAHPAARMPDLHLSPSEAHDLTCYLLAGASPVPATSPPAPETIAAGRALFAERGCANCHTLPDAARAASPRPPALRGLDAARGCLSGELGPWPFYALTAEQCALLTSALRTLDAPLDDEARIQQLTTSRNCLACHRRGDVGGVAAARDPFFTTGDPAIGAEARLPPPLTGVGAKLQPEWLVDAINNGQQARPYLRTRMPGFGATFAAELAPVLERTDSLPPITVAPLPDEEKAARAVINLGRELVGDRGMNCISCHRFAGEQAGAIGAIDLVESTGKRLRPEWFAHYLRAPFAFKPNTLMPQFFPDGVSVRPELGGGDVARQIDAMWNYLAQGRNVGQPGGMRQPPIELAVGDEAVLLRRSVQNTGKRGISVGYPGGVNLTFDAERLGLNQIWWGRFVDASPVWTGQGSGQAHVLGEQRVELPNGPAIVALPNDDEPWPTATRRELGQRWLGYDLDPQQRPSFRYVCAGVEVSDTPHEVRVDGARTQLRRTLRFVGKPDAGAAGAQLLFRVARDVRIDDRGEGIVDVGASLQLHLSPAKFRIRAAGEAKELLVPVPIGNDAAEVVIDYAWREDGK